jgi:hypothetical protein
MTSPDHRRTMRRVGVAAEPVGAWGTVNRRAVYEALVPLACGACLQAIGGGDHFTRRREGRVIAPVCRACVPFNELS